jgi:hypothetical protein
VSGGACLGCVGRAWLRADACRLACFGTLATASTKKNAFFLQKVCKKFAQYKIKLYICVVKERATLNARELSRATRQPREWRKFEKVMKYYVIVDGKFNYFESTAAADDFLIDCFLNGCKKIDWTIYEKIEKGDEVTAEANNNIYKLKTDAAGKLR